MEFIGPAPKKSTARKVAETASEMAVSAIPVAGGPAAVLLGRILHAGFERRAQEWLGSVFDALNDLTARVSDLQAEDLADNDQLLDAVAYATSAAIATGQEEKLDALRNAVLNAALPSDLDADTQAIFLRHVRDFTASHLRLLKLLDDPPGWYAARDLEWPRFGMAGNLVTVVTGGLPEFADRPADVKQLANDLSTAGLTTSGVDGTMMTPEGTRASRTSDTGKAFLRFITDPRERLS